MNSARTIEPVLPKGVADFLPEKAAKIAFIEEKICRTFELWGFRRIIPPLLEFDEVMAAGLGEDLRGKAFRFDDRHTGKLLAVPPDITPQVARMVATRLRHYPLPHRLYYNARVLRHAESQSGRSRDILQAGVELIGLDSPEADAEMVAMAVQVLQELGFVDFTMDLGHVEFFRGIMDAAALPQELREPLRDALAKKDSSAVADLLSSHPVSENSRREIAALPRLFGGRSILDEADAIVGNPRSRSALANLRQVVEILDIYGVADRLTIDLGEVRGFGYHSGVTFEGFAAGMGEALCSGGRYDTLTARYGLAAPATGFAFNVLTLVSGLEKRPEVEESARRDFLIFNCKEDRSEALLIAQRLRSQGFTVARDIIRRDRESSLDYAKRMAIRYMMVVGDPDADGEEVVLLRASDRQRSVVQKKELFGKRLQEIFPFVKGDRNG